MIRGTTSQNAAYLAAICDLKMRFRALWQGCDLGKCVAKTLFAFLRPLSVGVCGGLV